MGGGRFLFCVWGESVRWVGEGGWKKRNVRGAFRQDDSDVHFFVLDPFGWSGALEEWDFQDV